MNWEEVQQELIASLEEPLVSKGYKIIKSPASFQRKDALEKRFIFFGFRAKKDIRHHMSMWCGIQNKAIEEVFHRTSGVDKKNRRSYTVVSQNWNHVPNQTRNMDLESRYGIEAAKIEANKFVIGKALPFLEAAHTIADYSRMLNSNPTSIWCEYHGNIENRFHYGLICAKLAEDPCYETVKAIYAGHLQKIHAKFPYYRTRFRNLIADLEK